MNIKKKDGFVTLEFILVSTVLIPLVLSMISIFTYTYPAFQIQREIDVLTRQAQRDGGLTSANVSSFESRLSGMKFVRDSDDDIEIVAQTSPSKYNAINVTETNYISKRDGEVINMYIKVPSNNTAISAFTDNYNDYYEFNSSVVSEKY